MTSLRLGIVLLLLGSLVVPAACAQNASTSRRDVLAAAAERGDADAEFRLGENYYNKSPRDYQHALQWFQRAAEQGYAKAQARLGLMYYYGQGVAKDHTEGARWLVLAAKNGDDWAQQRIVELYDRGDGVPRDPQEARRWQRIHNSRHPDHSTAAIRACFAGALLLAVAFTYCLTRLQKGAFTGPARSAAALFVHVIGILLVLDSVSTYGFWLLFPHCTHSFLATACTQIVDPRTRRIVDGFGDWAMVNLIFRFMAIVGLLVDVLSVWYLAYVIRSLRGGAGSPNPDTRQPGRFT